MSKKIVEPRVGIVVNPSEGQDQHERDVQENVEVSEHGKYAHLHVGFAPVSHEIGDHETETYVDVGGGHGTEWMNGVRLFGFNWSVLSVWVFGLEGRCEVLRVKEKAAFEIILLLCQDFNR